jgi:N-acetylglucosaminyl-diphospho-decaprenol L-rhamnosyltransferase
MVDLSIIIVNWNSQEYLRQCLESMKGRYEALQVEVIVVDNASFDGSQRMVSEQFPEVVFVQSEVNLGFSRANNLGFARSKGEIILLLNPDTELIQGVLKRGVEFLRSEERGGAVGVRLLNTDGSVQTSCVQSLPTLLNQLVDSEILRRAFPRSSLWGTRVLADRVDEPAEVEAVSGAFVMVKRSAFEQVGLLSEDYFMYVEDIDLCWKLRKTGYGVYFLGDCEVIHHGGKSSGKQVNHFSDLAQREALFQYFRKTRGRYYAALYRLVVALSATVRIPTVVMMALLGGVGLQGVSPQSVLMKWVKLWKWAFVGLPAREGSKPLPSHAQAV